MDNFETLVDLLIQDEVKGISRHERIIIVGNTPDALQRHAEFEPHPLVIKASAISKMHFDHGMTAALIKRIPDLLAEPKAIYRSATHPTSAVVMTFEFKLDAPVIVIVQRNKLIGRNTVNECASMYGKQGPDPEKKWEEAGLLLWKSGG